MKKLSSFFTFCTIPFTLTTLSITSDAVAAQQYNNNVLKSGFYIGAGVGASAFDDKVIAEFKDADNNSVINATFTNQVGKTDFGGGGYIGYGVNFTNQFNLALEAFINGSAAKAGMRSVDYPDAQNPNNTIGHSADIEYRHAYGVRLLPGFQITDIAAAYAVVGYANGNFKMNSTNWDEDISERRSNSFNLDGFQVGIGTAVAISDKLFVRADILYTIYSTKTHNYTVGAAAEPLSVKNELNTTEGLISLVYNF